MESDGQVAALRDVADRARVSVNGDRCTIFEIDAERGEIFSRVAHGIPEGQEIRLPLTRGIIGFVARTGRSLRLRDAYNDPRFDRTTDERTGYRTSSMLCLPVLDAQANVKGAVQIINKLDGYFTEDDERTLAPFCDEVAGILEDRRP
jgi:adenylate cyclase